VSGRLPVIAVAVALAVPCVTACSAPTLRADKGVRITAPAPLTVVGSTFTVQWEVEEGGTNRYAVFVDRAPVAPGAKVTDLVDDPCRARPPCSDDVELQRKGIFVAAGGQATIKNLPPLAGMVAQVSHPVRTLTVAPLDAAGRRQGETIGRVEVRV
jgi:hypothetical protein